MQRCVQCFDKTNSAVPKSQKKKDADSDTSAKEVGGQTVHIQHKTPVIARFNYSVRCVFIVNGLRAAEEREAGWRAIITRSSEVAFNSTSFACFTGVVSLI